MADRIEVDQLSRWTGRPQTSANTITPKRRVLCSMLDRSRCGSTNDGQHVQDSGLLHRSHPIAPAPGRLSRYWTLTMA
jgi:hypothetical protein